jgi:hypothetical protein
MANLEVAGNERASVAAANWEQEDPVEMSLSFGYLISRMHRRGKMFLLLSLLWVEEGEQEGLELFSLLKLPYRELASAEG